MKNIAISNLAWNTNEDTKIFTLMAQVGIHYLEISPFRETEDPSVISPAFARKLLQRLHPYNIQPIAMQALLFRYPHLSLFIDKQSRKKTYEHLVNVIMFANSIGAKTLIFGSPKNKLRGKMTYHDAFEIAIEFFGKIAEICKDQNVTFCIEPTPSVYGADFIRDVKESVSLITKIHNSSLKLNLDIGSLLLNKEPVTQTILHNKAHIGHIHVSEPFLEQIQRDYAFHKNVAGVINDCHYKGVISIEMLPQPTDNVTKILQTITFVNNIYNKDSV